MCAYVCMCIGGIRFKVVLKLFGLKTPLYLKKVLKTPKTFVYMGIISTYISCIKN